jgi:hypothetical protein
MLASDLIALKVVYGCSGAKNLASNSTNAISNSDNFGVSILGYFGWLLEDIDQYL